MEILTLSHITARQWIFLRSEKKFHIIGQEQEIRLKYSVMNHQQEQQM